MKVHAGAVLFLLTLASLVHAFDPDPYDSEPMLLEASGSSRSSDAGPKKPDGDKPKTLSQQVADGKYGLIQKELFRKPPKRPGILSYDPNPDVPGDDADTLGGLDKNEIWLAENHLLVLRGGRYGAHEKEAAVASAPWPPIDGYEAPLHQVKIPARPKVPPPFPVQFTENGPLQLLGTNSSRPIDEAERTQAEAVLATVGGTPEEGPPQNGAAHTHKADATAGQAAMPVPVQPQAGEGPGGLQLGPPPRLNGSWPPYLGYLPPGAVILPPDNLTDLYDDDDPSIYYPPPYSFFYPKDNSSKVPAGPLVPGIVLPPPPNFFALLEDDRAKRPRRPITTSTTTTTTTTTTTVKPIKVYPVKDSYYNEISSYTPKPPTRPSPPPTPSKSHQRKRPENVTILRPLKSQTPEQYNPPTSTNKTKVAAVTTTQVPLKYYTTSNDIERPEKHPTKTRQTKTTPPAQYYYYEEQDTTPKTRPPPVRPRGRRPQYVYVTAKPYNTQRPRFRFVQQPVKSDTFSFHIAKLQSHIGRYYTTTRPRPRPVYSYSFEAANYRRPHDEFKPSRPDTGTDDFRPVPQRYSVEVQPSIQPPIPTSPAPRPQQPARPPTYSVEIQPAIQIVPTQAPQYYHHQHQSTPKPPVYYSTPRPIGLTTARPDYRFEPTQNPVYQGFYTKPDEGYFDDNTREYFTMFGRKLPGSTTPIPFVPFREPVPLDPDTSVNYIEPKPPANPDPSYPNVVRYTARPFRSRRPEPEIVKAVEITPGDSKDGSYISYQLPGDDGAHFYFLTPQLAKSRDQGADFYYSQSNDKRIRREGS